VWSGSLGKLGVVQLPFTCQSWAPVFDESHWNSVSDCAAAIVGTVINAAAAANFENRLALFMIAQSFSLAPRAMRSNVMREPRTSLRCAGVSPIDVPWRHVKRQ
jgi:hypothetical protein